MTQRSPEDKAAGMIVVKFAMEASEILGVHVGIETLIKTRIKEEIVSAIRSAVEAEREACAAKLVAELARLRSLADEVGRLREILNRDLNVTTTELIRIQNTCAGVDGDVNIWSRMLSRIIQSVRDARAALSPAQQEPKP